MWKARNAYVFEVSGPKKFLITRPGGFYLADYAPRGMADGFSMFLRKRVSGKVVSSVGQHNIDRVVFLELGSQTLVFELFGKGNIILLEDGRIEGFLRRSKRFEKGGEYVPPESVNYLSVSSEEFSKLVEGKDKAGVSRTLGIGSLVEEAWGDDMQAFLKKVADDPLNPEEVEGRFRDEDVDAMKAEAEDEASAERKRMEKSIKELQETIEEYGQKSRHYRKTAEKLMAERTHYDGVLGKASQKGEKRIKVTLLDK